MSKLLCTTPVPESRLPWHHTRRAAVYLGEAKLEVVRALRRFPEDGPLPSGSHPNRYRLQQIAAAISLLAGIVEPLAKDEPDESSISTPSEQKSEVGVDPGSGKSALASQITAENARLSRKAVSQ